MEQNQFRTFVRSRSGEGKEVQRFGSASLKATKPNNCNCAVIRRA
jgi:hypothetical protein